MIYELYRNYEFPIVGGRDIADDYFTVQVELSDNQTVDKQINKIQFQRTAKYSNSEYFHGKVKGFTPDGAPILAHNIPAYVYELYHEVFLRNETFECEVVSLPEHPDKEPYQIEDKYGIKYKFNDPDGLLVKGQILTCKITKLTPQYFSIQRVDQTVRLQFFEPDVLLEDANIRPLVAHFIKDFFMKRPEFEQARDELAAGRPVWLMTAANTVARHMPEWFLAGRLREQNRAYRNLLSSYTTILLHLLEGSSFLDAVPTEQRRALQQQLTDLVEGLEPFAFVLGLIARGQEDVFVEQLLNKLQRSGYIYHPARSFAVLMVIFRRHPDKVGNYLNRIFESIFGRDLDNWNREPFRSAFLEQFQIYVRQARTDIDALPLAETREAKNRIETVIIAIALQLLLSKNSDDNSRNWSMLYRYISLLRPVASEQLLSKAFLSLLGADIHSRISYEELRQPTMMMTRAMVLPAGEIMERIEGVHHYEGSRVLLSVSSDGLSLRPKDRPDITERAIPDGLMPWLAPQIYVNGVKGLSGRRLRALSDHNTWWHNIEDSLFEQDTVPETSATFKPLQGDSVYIVIDGVNDFNTRNPTFRCHVEDEGYESVTGVLACDQIVDYIVPRPPEAAWRCSNGHVRGFKAKVLTDDNDGNIYRFSLRELVNDYRDEVFKFTEEYVAKINAVTDNEYKALSAFGLGVLIERTPDMPELSDGDIIRFRLKAEDDSRYRGVFIDAVDDPYEAFTDNVAFERLMTSIGEEDGEGDESASFIRDVDEILSADDVREMIEVIRLRAIAEGDLVKAYDYLRFARLLALIIEDCRLAERLSAHATLLTMHQYFATNSRLDTDELAKVSEDSLNDPFLKMLRHRLELVSWLGHAEHNSELYTTVQTPGNELEGAIARMVFAYNMLQAGEGETSVANEIKQKIMDKLKVNNETKPGKYYGTESKYVEFKTSLVYPAVGPGEKMREAPEEQQRHILSRIAGLLNADGGRLYLGVNNEGYEVGMHDDFTYYSRHRMHVNNHEHRITDLDKLTVFLEDLINSSFPQRIARKIEVFIDDEAEKGVIGINIAQSLEPVFIDGRLYIRQSGQSTREYYGQAKEEFVREREELLMEKRRKARAEEASLAVDAEAGKETDAVAATVQSELSQPTGSDIVADGLDTPVIATSLWRPNVLHHYEADYVMPSGYLRFMKDNTVSYSKEDTYNDTGRDGCRLVLAISHELAHQYLVLGYKGEKMIRVPLDDISSKGDQIPQPLNDNDELIFAAIAHRDDAMVCVGVDSNDTAYMRGIKVSQIESGKLNGTPKRIHEAPISGTLTYEVVDSTALRGKISDCMGDKVGNRRFGISLRMKTTSPDYEERLSKVLLSECAPTTY